MVPIALALFTGTALALAVRSPAVGIVVFGYGVLAQQILARHRRRGVLARKRSAALDRLAAIAADLRAGLALPLFALPEPDLDRFARAARGLSDRSGAPLADLLDRLEAHQRGLSRVDDAAHAQSAGTRMTALLLIALPPAALSLGQAIGANAFHVLLYTPTGVACTAGALCLQLAGLAWTERIARPQPDRLETELAVACELMAAALRSGAPVPLAVRTVGDVLGGPLSDRLVQIGRELAAGVSPDQAWSRLSDVCAARRVIDAARRSAESGAAMSGALTRCADELRAAVGYQRQARLQRASVLLVFPLGLCFLPAFLLAGLVPVMLAVLGEVLK